jgi:pSer/pThr/pTyr-binding forkhead associated (FHA) protein
MARLMIKTPGFENQILELRLGVNRVGRDPECEFCIDHPTISSLHCKFLLSADGVYLQDCRSTNGTFVNGQPVMEVWLEAGQTVHLGEVELFVQNTEANIAIPQFERPRPKPPVLLPDGVMLCPRHPQTPVTYRCPHCGEVMCNGCVHILRVEGGQSLLLCPQCSRPCEPLPIARPENQPEPAPSRLSDTTKLKTSRFGRWKKSRS